MRTSAILSTAVAAVAAAHAEAAVRTETATFDFTGGNGAPNLVQVDGNIDGRNPLDDGLAFIAAIGDKVEVSLVGPEREFIGKTITVTVIPKYKFESKRGCKKHIEYQEMPSPVRRETPLVVGRDLRVKVGCERAKSGDPLHDLYATFGQPAEEKVAVPTQIRLELKYAPGAVAFARRDVTKDEFDRWIQPVINELQARPNVVGVRWENAAVEPGDVGKLGVVLKAWRSSQQ
jgi:hypothetical protein